MGGSYVFAQLNPGGDSDTKREKDSEFYEKDTSQTVQHGGGSVMHQASVEACAAWNPNPKFTIVFHEVKFPKDSSAYKMAKIPKKCAV